MLVTISVIHLAGGKVMIRAGRPQHDAVQEQSYSSINDARKVLASLGINEDAIASHLNLLAHMGAHEELKFPPMLVPKQELLTYGFRL